MSATPIRDQEYRQFQADAQRLAQEASLPFVRQKHLQAARQWGELAAMEEDRAQQRARRANLVEARRVEVRAALEAMA